MTQLPFVIIGYGGHSKCVLEALNQNGIKIHSIFDDNADNLKTFPFLDIKIQKIPSFQWWAGRPCQAIIAIGSNTARNEIANKLKGISWGNSIHPTAIVSKEATIGQGVYIGVNAIIQPGAVIGDHSIINTGAIIEHDVIIEDFCHIAPGTIITGGCKVDEGTLIGAGSIVIPEKHIGKWSIIGAGSVVISNIGDLKKAYGNPCREIQTLPF